MKTTKCFNKASGTTYVYEVLESYWDPEKKQARNKKRLIGKIDPVTGEMVPTSPRKKPDDPAAPNYSVLYKRSLKEIEKRDQKIEELSREILSLRSTLDSIQSLLDTARSS